MEIPYTISNRPDTGLWNAKIGIWLFLASEVMLFGGLFSAYVFLRLDADPGAWPHGLLNVPVGTTSCAGIEGADYVTNPKHQLKGVWTDPTPVPDQIVTLGLAENLVDDPLAMEAQRASGHFTYDPDATYIILTPPRPIATGQPVYCGYHTQTTSINGIGNPYRLEYSFIPWQNTDWPGLGQGCGLHNVNATSNAFGNGIFDSWSIVVGHEYSEAVTDPDSFFGVQDGWNDDQTSENADKCAWIETQNITLAGHKFAVQPTWSNEAFDAGKDPCAVSR